MTSYPPQNLAPRGSGAKKRVGGAQRALKSGRLEKVSLTCAAMTSSSSRPSLAARVGESGSSPSLRDGGPDGHDARRLGGAPIFSSYYLKDDRYLRKHKNSNEPQNLTLILKQKKLNPIPHPFPTPYSFLTIYSPTQQNLTRYERIRGGGNLRSRDHQYPSPNDQGPPKS
ncbi:protein E47B [Elephant endotheliotropic herpesvirus 5B]|nr:protein E47B [Elephant endotheliotropic herpesvirus 5B]